MTSQDVWYAIFPVYYNKMASFRSAVSSSSSSPSSAVPRPNPMVGNTALPKIPLSYKWVINDATTFLSKNLTLRSPPFSTDLPLKKHKKAFWSVVIKKGGGLFVLASPPQGDTPLLIELQHGWADTANRGQSCPSGMLQSRITPAQSVFSSRVLISDCNFFILDSQNKAAFSATAPNMECGIEGKSMSNTCLQSVQFCKYSDLHKYVYNGTLTIQVDATILCYTDPTQTYQGYQK